MGDIFGAPLAIEGIMAFFLESTFVAVMFFGWDKVSRGFHLSATWLTAIGANLSALWILVANSWMQYPVGCSFNIATVRNEMDSFWDVLFSPVAINKFSHTVTSSFLLAAIFVMGVSAWYLLRGRHRRMARSSIALASVFGLVFALVAAFSGDRSGAIVARVQPMKLAAMEALYDGEEGAPLTVVGLLRPEGQPGYKTEQLSPLCGLVYDADVVMVPEDGPYKTFKDLIEYAKANPGKVKVATVGKLTGDHLFLMQIEKLTGAKFTQVPYSGSGKAIPALLSGEVDAYFGSGSSFLRMEKTRGLAIGSKERYELCPDVPTFIEQGYAIESGKYRGLATPQNIPAEARQYLETKFAELCANPEYQKAVKSSGLMPQFQTGKAFGEIIRTEGEQAKKILEAYGLLK